MMLKHLLLFFIINWVCGDDFLAKFHQNVYKLRNFRAEVAMYDKRLINIFEAVTYKYNRTSAAVNCSMNFKINVEDKIMLVHQFYKKACNEYRRFPIRYQYSFASAVAANAGGTQQMLKCGNISAIYFLKDVTYHFCNYFGDSTQLPPLIPLGEYKVEVALEHLHRVLGVLDFYLEFYIPITYPSN